jgi:hypothetical protein
MRFSWDRENAGIVYLTQYLGLDLGIKVGNKEYLKNILGE